MAIIYIICACILLVIIHTLIWLFYQLRRLVALQLGTLRAGDASPFNITSVKMNAVRPVEQEKQQQQVALERF